MRAIKIHSFDSVENIIKKAKVKRKKLTFAQFPDGSVRIILNGTVNPYEEDCDEV